VVNIELAVNVVRPLPCDMVADSTYEWTVSFINPRSKKGLMNLILEITEEKTIIGFEEFKVEGFLDAYDILSREHYHTTITFTEVIGGVFQALQTSIEKRFNSLTPKIASVSNLMLEKYAFTLNITITY
jgi:hypothetical protein